MPPGAAERDIPELAVQGIPDAGADPEFIDRSMALAANLGLAGAGDLHHSSLEEAFSTLISAAVAGSETLRDRERKFPFNQRRAIGFADQPFRGEIDAFPDVQYQTAVRLIGNALDSDQVDQEIFEGRAEEAVLMGVFGQGAGEGRDGGGGAGESFRRWRTGRTGRGCLRCLRTERAA